MEEKGKGISLKVMRENALKMAMKWQHDLLYTDRFHRPLSFSLGLLPLLLIDSRGID